MFVQVTIFQSSYKLDNSKLKCCDHHSKSCKELTFRALALFGGNCNLDNLSIVLYFIPFLCIQYILVDCLVVPVRYIRCCKHGATAEGTMAPANSGLGPKSRHNCDKIVYVLVSVVCVCIEK